MINKYMAGLLLVALHVGCVSAAAQSDNQDKITVSKEYLTTGEEAHALKFTIPKSLNLQETTVAKLVQNLDTTSLLHASIPYRRSLSLFEASTLFALGGLGVYALKKVVERFSSSHTAACCVYGGAGIVASLFSLVGGHRAYMAFFNKGRIDMGKLNDICFRSMCIQAALVGLGVASTKSNERLTSQDKGEATLYEIAYGKQMNRYQEYAQEKFAAYGEINIQPLAENYLKRRESEEGRSWVHWGVAGAALGFGALAYEVRKHGAAKVIATVPALLN